jgi:hypothetical protein
MKYTKHRPEYIELCFLRNTRQISGKYPGSETLCIIRRIITKTKSVSYIRHQLQDYPESVQTIVIHNIFKGLTAYVLGGGFRGGNWNNNSDNLRVSDRNNAANVNSNRNNNNGFRGCRSVAAAAGDTI